MNPINTITITLDAIYPDEPVEFTRSNRDVTLTVDNTDALVVVRQLFGDGSCTATLFPVDRILKVEVQYAPTIDNVINVDFGTLLENDCAA